MELGSQVRVARRSDPPAPGPSRNIRRWPSGHSALFTMRSQIPYGDDQERGREAISSTINHHPEAGPLASPLSSDS
jgi:hypothetical protein